MYFTVHPTLAGYALACALFFAARTEAAPSDGHESLRADRTIVFEAVVDASPARVFELWTTPKLIAEFFAPKSIVEPRTGGKYEMIFDPKGDPTGDDSGTKGARILRFEPGKSLSFEWPSFSRSGRNPYAPPPWPEQRDARPTPTWVDIELKPIPGNAPKTAVRLTQHGFGRGEKWESSVKFFWRSWARVLGQLGAYCSDGCR